MQPDLDSMLSALRDCRQSSLKRGQWQPECSLEDLAKVVGGDVSRAADLFRVLVDDGYIYGWIRRKPYEWLSTEAQRVRNFVWELDNVRLNPAIVIEFFTDKGMERIDVSPERERRLDTLRALHGFRQSSLKRGQWRTECTLEDLAKVIGSDTLTTADLVSNLLEEGYLRGHLLYKRQDYSTDISPSDTNESVFVAFEELESFAKRSARPVRAQIEDLTERGLVAIGELPHPERENSANDAGEAYPLELASEQTPPPSPQAEQPRFQTEGATATFLSEMDRGTLNTSTFTLIEQVSGAQVAATVAYNPATKTATLHPISGLEPDKHYAASVKGGPTGVKDRAGNWLNRDYSWGVTTGQVAAAPDTIAPNTSDTNRLSAQYQYNNIVTSVSNFGDKAAEPAAEAFAPVVGALAGFVGVLLTMAYPAGLTALWIQISNQYGYGPWRALYAASLAPSAVVVGKVTWILLFAFTSALIPMWLWYAYARARVKVKEEEDSRVADWKLGRLQRFKGLIVAVFIAYLVVLLLWCVVLLLGATTDLWDVSLVSLFAIFSLAEVLFGGAFLFLRGIREESWVAARGSLYLGLAVVSVGSVAAGVCLTGLRTPALSTTKLTLDGPQRTRHEFQVGILNNANGYWYVVKYCDNYKFLAVPNTRVAKVDTIVDEPTTLEKEHSKEDCDITEPNTSIESARPDPDNDNTPTFSFGGQDNLSNQANLLYSHKVDNDKWSDFKPATSAKPASLPSGSHTFYVKAKDAAGNVDDDPAQRTWIVDTKEANTNIDRKPSDPTEDNTPAFIFSGKDNLTKKANLLFSYKVDKGNWSAYQSANRTTLASLPYGSHTFKVRAKDEAGNVDGDPDRYTWIIC